LERAAQFAKEVGVSAIAASAEEVLAAVKYCLWNGTPEGLG
jgi:hypothetical protein